MPTEFDQLAARYIEVWNETDPVKRRQDIEDLWTRDGRYVDPLTVAEGLEAIDATIAAVQNRFPGLIFRLVGPVDGHHNQARFSWELGHESDIALIVGFDVALTDGDGRLRQVFGFLDQIPPGV
jgi:hypothetical protein